MKKFKIFHFSNTYFQNSEKTFLFFSGKKSLKETITLEDGRIGERPEITYHVIHTILLGSLALIIEG